MQMERSLHFNTSDVKISESNEMFTLLIYVYTVELTTVLYAWKITAQTNKKLCT